MKTLKYIKIFFLMILVGLLSLILTYIYCKFINKDNDSSASKQLEDVINDIQKSIDDDRDWINSHSKRKIIG